MQRPLVIGRSVLPAVLFPLLASLPGLVACSDASEGPKNNNGGTTKPAETKPDAGGGDDDGIAPPEEDPTDGIDTGAGADVSDELAAKVVGTYALRSSIASIQDAPIVGKTPSVSTSFALAEIKREGGGLVIVERACHIEINSEGNVKPEIPAALPASIPPLESPFRVWDDNGTIRFVRSPKAVPVGVRLANPETDPLPTSDRDARVWDQDGDGKPGVTVRVSGIVSGDIYVVQRQKSAYRGTIEADGKLVGLVTDASQQSVVGASVATLKQNVPTTPDPDASKSAMRLVKLTEAYECPRLLRERDRLFR